ncbi:WD40 repeat-like protein [Trametopsis cervina]|nr:WD40 repeat-like protein [Trametopsis cervina]
MTLNKCSTPRNTVIGFARVGADSISKDIVVQDVQLRLTQSVDINGVAKFVPDASIHCKITRHSRAEALDQVMSHAENDVDNMAPAPSLLSRAFDEYRNAAPLANTVYGDIAAWEPVVDNVRAFAVLVKDILKIHPYAHAAWKLLSVIPALETDQQLRNLVAAMKHAYEFVRKAAPLEKIAMHVEFFEKLACATLECAHLIQEYVRTGNFAMRIVKNISGKAKKRLTAQIKCLEDLMNQFGEDAALHTEISVMRTLEIAGSVQGGVDTLTVKSYLDDMLYAKGSGCVPEKRCLPGTRRALLDNIIERLHGVHDDQASHRILLLTGVAGSGKSAVAHEIAHYFKSLLRRLGSSFCFSASNQAERSVHRFFSTISRNLAELDDQWRDALVDVIKSDREKRTTRSPREQLEEFIIKPAQKLEFVGPIVVVVDALDEAADDERKSLLDCLSRLATDTTLPDNIRFFLTSRPEPSILNALYGKAHIQHMDILSADATGDIRCFIEYELLAAPLDAEEATIRYEWAPYLNYIPGLSAYERFLMLQERQYGGLDSLYEAIINKIITFGNVLKDEAFEAALREKLLRVLSLVITAYEPLTWSAWVDLLGIDSEDVKAARGILPFLAPLFRGVSVADREINRPIQPAHTSLRDYLTQGTRKTRFRVDTSAAHVTLFDVCLRTMEAQLRFNICDLETSYRANKDVLDLAERIQHNISPALLYACRFWNSHLTAPPHEQVSLDLLFGFLETKLLFWIEVISLVRTAVSASVGIKEIRKWIQTSSLDAEERLRELDKILDEVDQFLSMCIPAISLSTPHLYLSALAYVPATSFINRYYSYIYTGGVRILNKDELRWPECVMRIATGSPINDVAISPDGRIIATAHDDRTIGLWNAVTGERVGEPLVGHTDWVLSVAFTPDGKTVASGSADNTVCLWNIVTGEQIGDTLRGHAGRVMSVAFSPDGQTLVSGSRDKTVRLWHVSSTEPAGEALVGHTDEVNSVAFSPCGRMFASGSYDRTVRVWSVETRELLHALEGHTSYVYSVAFSPDSRTLASGTGDNTIRLWYAATGQPKGEPLAGHTDPVMSVAFSPDGRTLASGSRDMTIRLWQVDTGKPVGDPLRGHTGWIQSTAFVSDSLTLISGANDKTIRMWKIDPAQAGRARSAAHSEYVRAVAFSPDNKTAVSASSDRTICLWDVRTGQPVGEPLRGHAGEVKSVVFSPDGRIIASSSADHTIRLWNAQTGQLLREPLAGHSGVVNSVAFSHDSKIMASSSGDQTIRLWSAVTGKELRKPLTSHTDWARSATFSPDSQFLASGSDDNTVMLWDVETRQPIGEPLRGHKNWVRAVAFLPDGTSIASGSDDDTIRLWRVDTHKLIGAPLEGHTGSVFSVAFSPDGKTLGSGSDDHTIRLWNVTTHAAIGSPLRGHTDWLNSIAFSPNGSMILSGSDDGTVWLRAAPIVDFALSPCPSSYWAQPPLPLPLDSEAAPFIITSSSSPVPAPMRDNEPLLDTSAKSQLNGYTNHSKTDYASGYILGPNSELLFWVPPDYRPGLWRPSTQLVSAVRSLRLDLSRFVHGHRWRKCRDGSRT